MHVKSVVFSLVHFYVQTIGDMLRSNNESVQELNITFPYISTSIELRQSLYQ